MPSKVYTISNFSGGANSKSDPSAIKENEAVSLVSLVPSREGKLKLAGRFINANVVGDVDLPADGSDISESDTTTDNDGIKLEAASDTLQNSGYGLFYFNHEKTSISDTNTLEVNGVPTQVDGGINYWVVQDNRYVKIYDGYNNKWLQTRIDIGAGDSSYPYVKPIYFFAENALRATSAPIFDTTFQRRWFGYIERKLFGYTSTNTDFWINHKRWYIDTAKILAPSASTYSQTLGSEAPGKVVMETIDTDSVTAPGLDGTDGIEFTVGIDTGTGTWLAQDYTFYISYIYDSSQESNVYNMGTVTINDNKTVLYTSLYIVYSDADDANDDNTGVGVSADGAKMNPRITGGRIYFSDPEDGNGILYHLMDFDYSEGCRKVGEEAFTSWTQITAGRKFKCPNVSNITTDGFSFDDPPKFLTYEDINGYKPFESLDASYSTMAVVGKRAYIGNVIVNGVRHNDRIMRSPINLDGKPQYDTFPESHFIDIGADDGDAIVKLLAAGDKLMVYKTSSTSVYNVGKFGGEFVEHVYYYNGIKHPTQATNTALGPVWVNSDGCWIYLKGQLKNLIEDKLVSSDNVASYASRMKWVIDDNDPKSIPSIGYLPRHRQLIVGLNIHHESTVNNDCWIYSFDTNSWSLAVNSLQTRSHTSNFINSRSGQLYALSSAYNFTDGGSEVIYDGSASAPADTGGNKLGAKQLFIWDGTPSKKAEAALITKEINFGDPNVIKKVYKIGLTFKTDSATNLKAYYAINGNDTIESTFQSSKGLNNASGIIEADSSAMVTQKAVSYAPGYWTPKYNGTATVTHMVQTLLTDSAFSAAGWDIGGHCSRDATGDGRIFYDKNQGDTTASGYARYDLGANSLVAGQEYTLTLDVIGNNASLEIKDWEGTTVFVGVSVSVSTGSNITVVPTVTTKGFRISVTTSSAGDLYLDNVVFKGPAGVLVGLWNNSSSLQLLKNPGGVITHIAGFKTDTFQPPSNNKMVIKFNSLIRNGGGGRVRLLSLGGSASTAVDVTAMSTYDGNSGGTYPQSVPLKGLGAGEISSDSIEIFEGVSYELQTVGNLSTLAHYVLVFVANELSTSDFTGFGISALSITDAGNYQSGLLQPANPISCKSIQLKIEGTATQDSAADVPANFELRDVQIYYRTLRPRIVKE
jgi:hypothetical protein